jgi:hypothetical protein
VIYVARCPNPKDRRCLKNVRRENLKFKNIQRFVSFNDDVKNKICNLET